MTSKISSGNGNSKYTRAQVPDAERCRFTSTHGRRCASPHTGAASKLCVAHARHEEKINKAAARGFSAELLGTGHGFQTRDDVKRVMTRVFSLVLERRIPRREGTLLAYIASLLLQTIPRGGDEGAPEEMESFTRELFRELPPAKRQPYLDEEYADPRMGAGEPMRDNASNRNGIA